MSGCCFRRYKKISIIPDSSNDFLNKSFHGGIIKEGNKKNINNENINNDSYCFNIFDIFCCKSLKKNVTFNNDL
jgi:hypothetical protein